MKELHEQSSIPVLLSYLKLYNSIPITKLANLMDPKIDVDTLRTQLLCMSHKSYQQKWSEGVPPIGGTWECSTELQFWIDGDVIHVVDKRVKKNIAQAFIRNSEKLEGITNELQAK